MRAGCVPVLSGGFWEALGHRVDQLFSEAFDQCQGFNHWRRNGFRLRRLLAVLAEVAARLLWFAKDWAGDVIRTDAGIAIYAYLFVFADSI